MLRTFLSRLRRRDRGYILFVSLGFAVLLGLGSLLAITPTIGEVKSASDQVRDKRAFFKADGGATLCRGELRNRLLIALAARLAALTNLTDVATYVANNDPAGFLAQYAYQAGTSFGGAFIRDNATQARLPLTYTATAGSTPYACTMTVISRAAPVNQGSLISPRFLFRYRYTIDGTGTEAGRSHQVNLQGIFSVLVQQDNFARYALFTNRQTNESGSRVWFTNRTNFSGPVHTNGEFNFALNPSGTFTGPVTSVSGTADYYNHGSPIHLDADNNADIDVPTFGGGFTRGVANIPMPSTTTADRQREAALGLSQGGDHSTYGAGVHLGTAGGAMSGGIYINGNATVSLSGAGGNQAVHTITQGGTTWTVTVNYSSNQTIIQQGNNPASTYSGVPNGMVFCDGQIDSLSGTVQADTQLTVAATGDVQITNNVTYENYTGGTSPSAEGATNLMGIISWNGDVRITNAAPNDISVHATVMTPNGEFRVDSYNSGSPRGIATLLGGVIENTYGAFGTFAESGQRTGYGRNFMYDTRMGRGIAPPFFPTIGTVTSMVSGINDRPNWQQTN